MYFVTMAGSTLAINSQPMRALRKNDRPLEDHLQDIYDVLREKEIALERVRQEVEMLRLACPLLLDENDSRTPVLGMQPQESNVVARPSDEVAGPLEPIRIQLAAVPAREATDESEKSALLRFREAALGASRKLLKRVRGSRLLESEFQQKTVRDLFERLSNAA